VKVLECGEKVLVSNPWDVGTQMDMAEAAEALGLLDTAVWTLEQARQKDPEDTTVNRALARLYEKAGNFSQAIALWELIRKADPTDVEAQHKAKDLAASDTIARGKYEAVFSSPEDDDELVAEEQPAAEAQAKEAPAEKPAAPVAAPTGPEPRE